MIKIDYPPLFKRDPENAVRVWIRKVMGDGAEMIEPFFRNVVTFAPDKVVDKELRSTSTRPSFCCVENVNRFTKDDRRSEIIIARVVSSEELEKRDDSG